MKKKSRPGAPPKRHLPYRFLLPRDLSLVKLGACLQALEHAYRIIRDQMPLKPMGVDALAATSALLIEQVTTDGKQGTNDPFLYRQTYIDTYVAAYPIAREQALTGQLVIDPSCPAEQRLFNFSTYAEQVLTSLLVAIDSESSAGHRPI